MSDAILSWFFKPVCPLLSQYCAIMGHLASPELPMAQAQSLIPGLPMNGKWTVLRRKFVARGDHLTTEKCPVDGVFLHPIVCSERGESAPKVPISLDSGRAKVGRKCTFATERK